MYHSFSPLQPISHQLPYSLTRKYQYTEATLVEGKQYEYCQGALNMDNIPPLTGFQKRWGVTSSFVTTNKGKMVSFFDREITGYQWMREDFPLPTEKRIDQFINCRPVSIFGTSSQG